RPHGPGEHARRGRGQGHHAGRPAFSLPRILTTGLNHQSDVDTPGRTRPCSYPETTAWTRSRRPSLARIRTTWVLTVPSPTMSARAISALDRPRGGLTFAIRTTARTLRGGSAPRSHDVRAAVLSPGPGRGGGP